MIFDHSVTRKVFEGLSSGQELLFYVLAFISTAIFFVGLGLKVRKYLRGRFEDRFGSPAAFARRALAGIGAAAANRTVARRDPYAGLFHAAIMWGFVVLFMGTVILTVDTDIVGTLAPQYHFFWGGFYVVYSFVLDVLGLVMLVGLAAMAWRRARLHPPAVDYRRVDLAGAASDRTGFVRGDWVFLGWLFVLGVTGFLVEAVRILGHRYPWFEVFSPVGWVVAHALGGLGVAPGTALALHFDLWWVHAVLALGFVAYVPYAKAAHILADGANLVLRSPLAGRQLPVLAATARPAAPSLAAPIVEDGHLGQRDLADLSWKQLLDLDACTKCGRCHAVCPAVASGAPLSPRDLVLDLRQQADAAWGFLAPGAERRTDLTYGAGGPVAGGLFRPETLWSCTTCLACVEACPAGVEHVPLIVGMRRSLVDQGMVAPTLQAALTSLGKQGNSFGQSGRLRGRWAEGLPTPIKDARKEAVEWLWFVGDFASFDLRVQEATRLVARVLQSAGTDVGILYEGERNAGNDVRRVGEEGLFEMLVEHNVGQLSRVRFQHIVTTDPHTLNTLRFEYPQFGGDYSVWHYSELLIRLFREGRLEARRAVGRRVTYHDPCYLARYSGVTLPPRQVLGVIGAELVEMPRNRANTFCCGAGGGRIWMDDSALRERPSEQRIREAAGLAGVTDFVTACPKDLTMYTAAAKATGNEGRLVVHDLIELVAEAIGLVPLEPGAEAATALSALAAASPARPQAAPADRPVSQDRAVRSASLPEGRTP